MAIEIRLENDSTPIEITINGEVVAQSRDHRLAPALAIILMEWAAWSLSDKQFGALPHVFKGENGSLAAVLYNAINSSHRKIGKRSPLHQSVNVEKSNGTFSATLHSHEVEFTVTWKSKPLRDVDLLRSKMKELALKVPIWEKELSVRQDCNHTNSGNCSLIRYMPLWQLSRLLQESALHFCRMDGLKSKHEVHSTEGQLSDPMIAQLDKGPNAQQSELESLTKRRLRYAASSWQIATTDSDVAWSSFSRNPHQNSIAIATTAQALAASLSGTRFATCFGQVRYIDFKTDLMHVKHERELFFYRPIEFCGHNEYRILAFRTLENTDRRIDCPKQVEFNPSPEVIGESRMLLPVNNELLIERTILHPNAEPHFIATVTALFGLYCPSKLNSIQRSSIERLQLYCRDSVA